MHLYTAEWFLLIIGVAAVTAFLVRFLFWLIELVADLFARRRG